VKEFQTHVLYGFLVGVLLAMANTDVAELNQVIRNSDHPDKREVHGPTVKADDAELNNRLVNEVLCREVTKKGREKDRGGRGGGEKCVDAARRNASLSVADKGLISRARFFVSHIPELLTAA